MALTSRGRETNARNIRGLTQGGGENGAIGKVGTVSGAGEKMIWTKKMHFKINLGSLLTEQTESLFNSVK